MSVRCGAKAISLLAEMPKTAVMESVPGNDYPMVVSVNSGINRVQGMEWSVSGSFSFGGGANYSGEMCVGQPETAAAYDVALGDYLAGFPHGRERVYKSVET